MDGDLDLARADNLAQPRRHFRQPAFHGEMGEQGRAGRVKRAFLRQQADIEGVDRPRGRAETDKSSERPQAVQRTGESALPMES